MNKTVRLYEAIRLALGFKENEKHQWMISSPEGSVTPVTIKGKYLVTPHDEVLKEADWDTQIAFHPVCENFRRKKSIIQERLQRFVELRIRTVMISLMTKMVEIYADTDCHDKLSADQREFLKLFAVAGKKPAAASAKKTYDNVVNLCKKFISASPGIDELVGVGERRGGTWRGEEYARLATITFPVMAEEFNGTDKIYDVSMTKRDKDFFYRIMRYLLPNVDNTEAYSYGSRSEIAPRFHCLMSAFAAVAADLNKVTRALGDIDDGFLEENIINTTWNPMLTELYEIREEIPILDGNDGDPEKKEVEKEKRVQERKPKVREQRREEERREREERSGNRFSSRRSSRDRDEEEETPRNPYARTGSRRSRYDDDEDDRRGSRRGRNMFTGRSRRDEDDDEDDRGSRRRRGRNMFTSRRDDDDDDYDTRRRSRRSRFERYDEDEEYETRSRRSRRREEEDEEDDNRYTIDKFGIERDENGISTGRRFDPDTGRQLRR